MPNADEPQTKRVAIIGAGISAAACAKQLHAAGIDVSILEKSRGVGGRMATRRVDGDRFYDHGAQYFTARDPRFSQRLAAWVAAGVAAEWSGRIAVVENGAVATKDDSKKRYVGVPNQRSLCQELLSGLSPRFESHIEQIESIGPRWRLVDRTGEAFEAFDAVLVSCPAPQAASLLRGPANKLAQRAASVAMQGCWAVMLGFDRPLEASFDGAFVHGSPLSWIARNASKPGREAFPETWVLHASSEWSQPNLERDPEAVLRELVNAFWHTIGVPEATPTQAIAHRWRYALPTEPLAERFLWDGDQRIGACGDWCGGPRVEGAFLSGLELSAAVREALH